MRFRWRPGRRVPTREMPTTPGRIAETFDHQYRFGCYSELRPFRSQRLQEEVAELALGAG